MEMGKLGIWKWKNRGCVRVPRPRTVRLARRCGGYTSTAGRCAMPRAGLVSLKLFVHTLVPFRTVCESSRRSLGGGRNESAGSCEYLPVANWRKDLGLYSDYCSHILLYSKIPLLIVASSNRISPMTNKKPEVRNNV